MNAHPAAAADVMAVGQLEEKPLSLARSAHRYKEVCPAGMHTQEQL